MTVYTTGNVPCDDLQVGDQVMFSWMTTWGPITAIHPYRCSERCAQCRGTQCPHVAGWRFARFAGGQEITMAPGDEWFPGPAPLGQVNSQL